MDFYSTPDYEKLRSILRGLHMHQSQIEFEIYREVGNKLFDIAQVTKCKKVQ